MSEMLLAVIALLSTVAAGYLEHLRRRVSVVHNLTNSTLSGVKAELAAAREEIVELKKLLAPPP